MSDEEVLEVVETLNRAFAADAAEAYFSLIDEEITVLTPSNPYRVEGIEDDREEFEWGLETGRNRVGYFQEMQPRVQRFSRDRDEAIESRPCSSTRVGWRGYVIDPRRARLRNLRQHKAKAGKCVSRPTLGISLVLSSVQPYLQAATGGGFFYATTSLEDTRTDQVVLSDTNRSDGRGSSPHRRSFHSPDFPAGSCGLQFWHAGALRLRPRALSRHLGVHPGVRSGVRPLSRRISPLA